MIKSKATRQRVLKQIVTDNRIASQEDLLDLLIKEGIEATQATLSRDLKELRIVKMHSKDGGYYYSQLGTSRQAGGSDLSFSSSAIFSVEFSGQLGVIKTRPGYANMIATVIDSSMPSPVMGTIAGDDTLLILMKAGADVDAVLTSIEMTLPGIKSKLI